MEAILARIWYNKVSLLFNIVGKSSSYLKTKTRHKSWHWPVTYLLIPQLISHFLHLSVSPQMGTSMLEMTTEFSFTSIRKLGSISVFLTGKGASSSISFSSLKDRKQWAHTYPEMLTCPQQTPRKSDTWSSTWVLWVFYFRREWCSYFNNTESW